MSHELRTPLNAILGFSQLLELSALTEKQRESVDHIVTGGRHLLQLIDEVLDIARVESGRIEMSPEAVSVHDLALETLALIHPFASQRGITTDLRCLAGGPHVTADRQRLKQVLLNLLSNAVKYNVPGGHVTLDCHSPAPGRLRLCVADTGPGVSAEMRPRLFTPFDRLGVERIGGGVAGTGLGLALSKRLMEAMGGDLGLEDGVAPGPNPGAVFWIELPLATNPLGAFAAAPADASAALAPAAAERLPTDRTLLYIEDNPSNLKLIENLLELHPEVRLLTATQGRLGLDLAHQHRPDLILLDVHLPDISGGEVLAQLRAGESTRDIPVVIVSADATQRQIERLLAAGAHAYLTKPLDIEKFLALVREVLLARDDKIS